MKTLDIIIISFNTSDLLRKCLNKVYKALSFAKIEKESEVFVVDNASSDDSVARVEKKFPKVIIIKNSQNLGFAKANNQGIAKAKGQYILLLNSDTEVKENSLINLLSTIRKDKNIGVAGGKLLNGDGSVQYSVGYFPSLFKVFCWMFFWDDLPWVSSLIKPYHVEDKSFYSKEREVDWVSGACMMLRREIVEKIGGFDEKIFMYGEEVEWCYRIKKQGYKVIYTSEAKIVHLKGASTKDKEAGILEEFGGVIYFYKKHKSYWQLQIVKILLFFGALLRLFVFGIIGRYPRRVSLYAQAFGLLRR